MTDELSAKLPKDLLTELAHALSIINDYGSVEFYIQNGVITQITMRHIRKTKMTINGNTKPYSHTDSSKPLKQEEYALRY